MGKKVVLLAPLPPPYGGIAVWTTKMMNTKFKKDWQIEIVDERITYNRGTYTTKKNYIKELKRCFKIWKNVIKKAKSKEVRVFHSCIPANSSAILKELVCLLIAHHYKKKFIIHFRCTVPNIVKTKFNLFLLKRICKKSDYIITLNNKSKEFVEKYNKNTIIIPNFIELIPTKKATINKEVKKVLYSGGVMNSKGCDKILKLSELNKDVEFYLIGNVKDDFLKIYDKDNHKNVFLLGELEHDRVLEYLSSTDIFIFLSRYEGEGFSNSLLEAMSFGIPCLVSDWAANYDMIENKGGIVTQEADDIINNDFHSMFSYETRKQMSDWNVEKVKNNYMEEKIVNEYINIYEKVGDK